MNTLNTGTRIGAMVMDHGVMTFAVMIVAAPGVIFDIVQTTVSHAPPKLFLGNYYINIFAFSLYFNKDIVLGRSIAKRVLKLQLVDAKTGKPAHALKCLVRNLTIVLWPIEVIAALINNERRIGDFIAGTKLVPYNPDQHRGKVNWVFVVMAVLISMVVTYFVMFYPMELLLNGSGIRIH